MTCPEVLGVTHIDAFCAVKDPAEVLDYTITYENLFNESDPPDSIASSSWTIETHASGAALTIDSDTFTTIDATAWISAGGKTNTFHRLVNHVITVAGREHERTITIWIQSK